MIQSLLLWTELPAKDVGHLCNDECVWYKWMYDIQAKPYVYECMVKPYVVIMVAVVVSLELFMVTRLQSRGSENNTTSVSLHLGVSLFTSDLV